LASNVFFHQDRRTNNPYRQFAFDNTETVLPELMTASQTALFMLEWNKKIEEHTSLLFRVEDLSKGMHDGRALTTLLDFIGQSQDRTGLTEKEVHLRRYEVLLNINRKKTPATYDLADIRPLWLQDRFADMIEEYGYGLQGS